MIPATTTEPTQTRTDSFKAAFMLGMKEYFGNVDHLRATVSDVPVENADFRKQYLVIYDSVPGGTGYLKQLMHDENALISIFEKALDVLEKCSCKNDTQKDGCYHCLFAYRDSKKIGNLSRSTAIRLIKSILNGKENIKKIDKLRNISVNSLFDSELEQMFVETFHSMGNDSRKIDVTDDMISGKKGYIVTIRTAEHTATWSVEPQVELDETEGVYVKCKPDFVLTPLHAGSQKKIAIFTDGFQFHKDIAASDTLKREAIRRSGKYRVWSLSYKDVQQEQLKQSNYASASLVANNMPMGTKMYNPTINAGNANCLKPESMTPFELLIQYMEVPEAEKLFATQARAYSLSLLDMSKFKNDKAFDDWKSTVEWIDQQTHYCDTEFTFGNTMFGKWIPGEHFQNLDIYAGISTVDANNKAPVPVVCVLRDDEILRSTDDYESNWNELWHFMNVMQFAEKFIAVSSTGINQNVYLHMPIPSQETEVENTIEKTPWDIVLEDLFDEEAKQFAEKAKMLNIPVADEVGYDLVSENGAVIATLELAWTSKKICFMTQEQLADKDAVENDGWTIISIESLDNKDLFGGMTNG